AWTPAAFSRIRASSSAAVARRSSGALFLPIRRIASAESSPAAAIARLRRLSTRKPEFIHGGDHGRGARNLHVHVVLARLDFDALGHRFAGVLGPRFQLV